MTAALIDLAGVALQDDRPSWLHAFPVGEYDHPQHGRLIFTRERLERFAGNIRARARGIDLAVDYAHREDPSKGHRAAGWITDAEVRGDGLWIAVRWTDEARREVRAGHWRYLSPEYLDEWADASGREWRDVLVGAALTNRPFLKELAPIAASEDAARGGPFVALVEHLAARTGEPFGEVAREVSRLVPGAYADYRRSTWG